MSYTRVAVNLQFKDNHHPVGVLMSAVVHVWFMFRGLQDERLHTEKVVLHSRRACKVESKR